MVGWTDVLPDRLAPAHARDHGGHGQARRRPAPPENLRDLLGPAPRLDPVRGVPARREVEAPSRIVPLLESRDLDVDALAACQFGHARI